MSQLLTYGYKNAIEARNSRGTLRKINRMVTDDACATIIIGSREAKTYTILWPHTSLDGAKEPKLNTKDSDEGGYRSLGLHLLRGKCYSCSYTPGELATFTPNLLILIRVCASLQCFGRQRLAMPRYLWVNTGRSLNSGCCFIFLAVISIS